MGMSAQEFDNMLYRDFILKMEGFKQRQEYEENIYRTVAFSAYIAPHLNPKKLAVNIDKFWPMKKAGADTKKVSDAKRRAIRLALQQDQELKATKDG